MMEFNQRLMEIDEVSFMVNDLNLYLDTHPEDQKALHTFNQAMEKRKQLMESYARDFAPLTLNCIKAESNRHQFSWSNGPAPWDNQTTGGAY